MVPIPFTPMNSTLDIVIVNWNAGALLRRCVGSIAAGSLGLDGRVRVVVVDNASTDGSLEGLSTGSVPLRIVRNAANLGFAAACNQGADGSTADHLLFLNPDTMLPEGCLAPILGYADGPEGARAGIVGCRLIGEDGSVQRSCARFPEPHHMIGRALGLDRLVPALVPPHFLTLGEHDRTRTVDQVMGAFMLIRRPLFETLGGFDERFFVYYDDLDLCLRAHAAGWSIVYLAEVSVVHHGCGTTDQVRDRRLFYNLRSRMLYAGKHFSRAGAFGVALATLFLEPAVRIARSVLRGSIVDAREVVRGAAMLFRDLPCYSSAALGAAERRR